MHLRSGTLFSVNKHLDVLLIFIKPDGRQSSTLHRLILKAIGDSNDYTSRFYNDWIYAYRASNAIRNMSFSEIIGLVYAFFVCINVCYQFETCYSLYCKSKW